MSTLHTFATKARSVRSALDPFLDATIEFSQGVTAALSTDDDASRLPEVGNMLDALRELHSAAMALKSGLVGVETAARTMAATYARMEARRAMKSWITFGDN